MTDATALLRLQEIDLELLRHRTAVQELPQKERIGKIRRAAKQVSGELTKTRGQLKDLEMELADNLAAHEKVSALVDEAQERTEQGEQDFRAIQDLESQLTTYAKRLEKLDFDREHLEEDVRTTTAREQELEGWRAKAAAEEKVLLDSYKQELDRVSARVEELGSERSDVVDDLDPAQLDRYSKASKRFGGLAVETLNGNKPSICRVSLSPGQYQDLMGSGESVCECPYCHRILITREG